jgi:glycosyltransferase involved in cell wall biosynthesis
VLPQYKVGGGNRVFIELANHCSGKIKNVEIIYPNNSQEKNSYKLDPRVRLTAIGRLGTKKYLKVKNILFLFFEVNKRIAAKSNLKVVISDPILCLFLLLFRKEKLKSVVRYIQADDYSIFDDRYLLKNIHLLYLYKYLTKKSYQLNLCYFFNSDFTYNCFIKHRIKKNVVNEKILPAVDTTIFYSDYQYKIKNKLNLSIIGRVHPLKGFSDFIDAWDLINDKIKLIVGSIFVISPDELTNFNVNGFEVISPKSDREIANIYRNSDIFISTSKWEGFGLPPLEAMHCGAVVITSSSGGIDEYIKDGINALKYEAGNIGELKNKLQELLIDIELRDKLRRNMYNTISHITWESSGEKFISNMRKHNN